MKPIDLFRPHMAPTIPEAIARTLQPDEHDRVWIGQGPKVEQFEAALQEYLQSPVPVVTTNSGTSALDLALHLSGVRPENTDDEMRLVISTPMTCTATNLPVVTRGWTILWADVDQHTGLIDPESVASQYRYARDELMSPVKAVLCVDWGGRLCDYQDIREALFKARTEVQDDGEEEDMPTIIQDAAHSFGAHHNGKPFMSTGQHGDIVCFSFQAIKHLTTVDGGAIAIPLDPSGHDGSTDWGSKALTERVRKLRWYGLDRNESALTQRIDDPGFKYHMNDVTATIGLENLEYVDVLLSMNLANVREYERHLQGIPGVVLPPSSDDAAWWLYTLLVQDRASFIGHLATRGIMASSVHVRNDWHPAFRDTPTVPDLSGLNKFATHEVAIPFGWHVRYDDQQRVIQAVQEWSDAWVQGWDGNPTCTCYPWQPLT